MTLFSAHIRQKKGAKQSIPHLGSELLNELSHSPDLKSRIDDGNTLHIRLDLSRLVSGSIELSDGSGEQVKGRIKLEVYPGQDPIENARLMLAAAAAKADSEGLPIDLDL